MTDIRNLLKHSPNASPDPRHASEKTNGEPSYGHKCPSHFYQYHQHLQYQPHIPSRDGSWSSSPEQSDNRKQITSNSPTQQKHKSNIAHLGQIQKSSMFSFNFLQKAKDHGNARREKANPNKEKRGNKEKNLENESRLIENYLSNPQRSKKYGLTLQQQYFQSQQQKQAKVMPTRRILESHSYQNVSDEDRLRSPQQTKVDSGSSQQVFRKFGDTNLMPPKQKSGGCHVENGVYRYSPHITSFAELDYANRNIAGYEQQKGNFNISKYLNIDVKSGSSAYSSGSNLSPPVQSNLAGNKKPSNRSSPNLQQLHHHHDHSNSSSSSLLSDKSSCSTSSLDQRSYFIGEPHEYGSYLGPFNFRQLLRPTQGPTESLRKRKGVNTNSPPPPQRGKSFI